MGDFGRRLEDGRADVSQARTAQERAEAHHYLMGEIAKLHLQRPGADRGPSGPPVSFGELLGRLAVGSLVLFVVAGLVWALETYTERSANRRAAEADYQRLKPVIERVQPDYGGFVNPRWFSPTDTDAYLMGLPTVAAIDHAVSGPTPLDTAVRKVVAFETASRAVMQLAGRRRLEAKALSAAEQERLAGFGKAAAQARAQALKLGSQPILQLMHENLSYANALTRMAWGSTTTPEWRRRYFTNWAQIEAAPAADLLTAAQTRP